jgi:hypothetical protein
MSDASVVWSGSSDEDEESADAESHQPGGDLDETFAARRLRRWLKGMFGGGPVDDPEPRPDQET